MNEQAEKKESKAENISTAYTPERGDVFEWCDEQYFCVENNGSMGVVNPLNRTYYVRNFMWNFKGEKAKFLRKATEDELRSLGMDDLIQKA